MPGICRDTTDSAGGALIKSQTKVFANSEEVIVHGDTVTAHLTGLHAAPPTMIASHTSSDKVFIGGIVILLGVGMILIGKIKNQRIKHI